MMRILLCLLFASASSATYVVQMSMLVVQSEYAAQDITKINLALGTLNLPAISGQDTVNGAITQNIPFSCGSMDPYTVNFNTTCTCIVKNVSSTDDFVASGQTYFEMQTLLNTLLLQNIADQQLLVIDTNRLPLPAPAGQTDIGTYVFLPNLIVNVSSYECSSWVYEAMQTEFFGNVCDDQDPLLQTLGKKCKDLFIAQQIATVTFTNVTGGGVPNYPQQLFTLLVKNTSPSKVNDVEIYEIYSSQINYTLYIFLDVDYTVPSWTANLFSANLSSFGQDFNLSPSNFSGVIMNVTVHPELRFEALLFSGLMTFDSGASLTAQLAKSTTLTAGKPLVPFELSSYSFPFGVDNQSVPIVDTKTGCHFTSTVDPSFYPSKVEIVDINITQMLQWGSVSDQASQRSFNTTAGETLEAYFGNAMQAQLDATAQSLSAAFGAVPTATPAFCGTSMSAADFASLLKVPVASVHQVNATFFAVPYQIGIAASSTRGCTILSAPSPTCSAANATALSAAIAELVPAGGAAYVWLNSTACWVPPHSAPGPGSHGTPGYDFWDKNAYSTSTGAAESSGIIIGIAVVLAAMGVTIWLGLRRGRKHAHDDREVVAYGSRQLRF